MNKEDLARQIVTRLHSAGFDAYWAGGCVRDVLLGKAPKDFDIATSAHPKDVQALFDKTVPVGAHFGVILVVEEDVPFEVATFRSETGYLDGRHPTEVRYSTLPEDAERRDFTVNGLYFDIRNKEVVDLVGGREDIQRGVIRTIGNAKDRFQEDHLRLMRAIRFAVRLGFEIEPRTWEAIQEHAPLITKISSERIRDELSKTLISAQPARGIRLLDEAGLLKEILPEVLLMKGVEQPMEFHPEGDVFVHTLMLLDPLHEPPLELALGALFHDIAKPQTFERAADRIRFHGHDTLGAEMTESILRRLTYPNDTIEIVCSLVKEHLRFKDAFQMRVSTLKRFLSLDRFDLHLALHRLDCMASHGKLDAYEFCKEKYEEFLRLPPPPSKLVTGHDLLERGLKPGPQYATLLRAIEDAVLEGQVKTREEALALLDSTLGNHADRRS